MNLRRRPRGRLLAGVVVLAALVAVVIVVRQPAAVTARTLRIAVVDGPGHDQHVSLDATFFTPPGRDRVPAILLAHGFGGDQGGRPAGSRATGPGRLRGAHLVRTGIRPVHRPDRPGRTRLRGERRRATGELAGPAPWA